MGFLSKLKELIVGETIDYHQKIKDGAKLVDVRTPGEFKSGNAKGSINIPLQTLGSNLKQLQGKEVVLVCRSGARASSAKAILAKNGIVAYNAGAWTNI